MIFFLLKPPILCHEMNDLYFDIDKNMLVVQSDLLEMWHTPQPPYNNIVAIQSKNRVSLTLVFYPNKNL